jgi:hypothetical protein
MGFRRTAGYIIVSGQGTGLHGDPGHEQNRYAVFFCALSTFAVAVGYGAVHLAGYLASLNGRSTKPEPKLPVNGIWDRELDVLDGLY